MSTKDDGGHVFPQSKVWNAARAEYEETDQHPGMTLRDYFAAKAMQALLYESIKIEGDATTHRIARDGYRLADAMLIARAA
jgi:hypothetical protein